MAIPTNATILAHYRHNTGQTFSSNKLTQWNDATGNGYHATNNTGTGPGEIAVAEGGQWDRDRGFAPVLCAGDSGFLDIPTSLSMYARDVSVVMLLRQNPSPLAVKDQSIGAPFTFGGAEETQRYMCWSYGPTGQLVMYPAPGGSQINSEIQQGPGSQTPTVLGFSMNASGTKFLCGDRVTSVATVANDTLLAGGQIATGLASQVYSGFLYDLAITEYLDEDGLLAWRNYYISELLARETKNASVLLLGDSIPSGENGGSTVWPAKATIIEQMQELPGMEQVYCTCSGRSSMVLTPVGTSGSILHQIQQFAAHTLPTLGTGESTAPYEDRIAIIWGGSNNVALDEDHSTIYGKYQECVAALKANGATQVWIATIIARTGWSGSKETVRDSLNTAIMTDTAGIGHDAGINMHQTSAGGDDRFDDYESDLFDADGTHPNYAGSQVAAARFAGVVAEYLGTLPRTINLRGFSLPLAQPAY